ncbi:Hypothetical_protein [Hexamita inflata]|uniref:Hypothetical_protein n=1 Tax=Hexamita inflata TaxID=28002 RepID=A0ABP1HP42_9EUKA
MYPKCIQNIVEFEGFTIKKTGLKHMKFATRLQGGTTQPCLQGSSLFAYKGVTDFNSLISKNVSKMYLVELSNLNDLWLKNKVKNYGICHLLIREFCMRELPYK